MKQKQRSWEDNGQTTEKFKTKLESLGREIEEKVKTLRNKDCLLRVQKHFKGRQKCKKREKKRKRK